MTKAMKFLGLCAILTLAVYAGKGYDTPEGAAMGHNTVNQYLGNGFVINDTMIHQTAYITEPTGAYHWGVVQVLMQKSDPGPSLQTTYATIYLDIQHSLRGKKSVYSVTDVRVEERILY